MSLNGRTFILAESLALIAKQLRIALHTIGGATVLDFGIGVEGGLQAGLDLARVCLADHATVALVPGPHGPAIQVASDDPVRACMASQYAGWQVSVGKFFAMGSGPMRAIYAKEPLFEHIPGKESSPDAVGVLETRKLPTDEVITYFRDRLTSSVKNLTLLCAPASSIAGSVQVVARSLETALHKMHELQFDLKQVISGYGVAPLPPIAADEITAIGRTNDAILYGGEVTVWLRGDDEQIAALGPRVPSSSSKDHGAPFAEIFERYNRDFYKIDPHLFSPAVITLCNLTTGRRHVFGRLEPTVLARSFSGTSN
jgi:methenyltetrahydromethanopterin cyclohydrolase